MGTKRCFVISPIGVEGSPTREHADDVYDYIIKPAMEACGIEAFRSDHLPEPGRISEQMFKEILNDDLCIAVLTGSNPNVYYELAIAQAAARPAIILLEKGQPLPFDIQDLRCVYYDLTIRSYNEKVYIQEVIEQIRSLEKTGWRVTIPWESSGLYIAGRSGAETYRILDQSVDFGSPGAWMKLLQDSQQAFDIMGISLISWKSRTRRFSEGLMKKAADGCKIRILLMHKDNPCLPHLINSAIPETHIDSVVHEMDEMYEYFSGLATKVPNIEVRQMIRGCPHCQIVRSDSEAVSVFYLYSERTHFSPLWQCPRGSSIYTKMEQEFEALWQTNALDAEN